MNSDARILLTTLGDDGYLSVCWKKPADQGLSHAVLTLPEALVTIDALGDTADVWYGVNRMAARPSSGRGRAADITRITCLYADLDTGKPLTPGSVTEARTIIDGLPEPACIVYSGHGLQPIWPLTGDEFTTADPAILTRWGQLIADRCAARGWVTDNVYDLARILRVPGTVNHKQPGKPVRATLELAEGTTLTYDEITGLLDEHEHARPPRAITASGPGRPAASSHAVRGWLDQVAAFAQPSTPYGGQALAELLAEYGTREFSRHRWMIRSVTRVLELAATRDLDARQALAAIRDRFTALIAGERAALPEFIDGVAWGVGQLIPAAPPGAPAAAASEPDSTGQLPGCLPEYDLGALAAAGIKEPERIAGGMLYPGSVHCLAGPPGSGKTTIMAWWMLRHIRDGGHVMLLDEESGPEQAAEKFLDLGATADELSPPGFTYVPFPARGWNTADLGQLHELIRERKPGIIGWDSAAAFLAIAGQDENSATDVTAFWQRVLVPCARQFSAAVLALDHITKNGEHGGYGRGSGAKKAASDVQYILDVVKQFNRTENGILRLTTAPGKDRRGWLAMAYEVHVRIGTPLAIEITEASGTDANVQEMKPAKAKLWEALNAIATEEHPATSDQLVTWIKKKYDHGLRRPTCSTFLNELAADGLADGVRLGSERAKFWHPLQVSASDDASAMTRPVSVSPPVGADDDDDTSRTHRNRHRAAS